LNRALITGITGQDGFHLTEFLTSKNYKIFGLLNGQRNSRANEFSNRFPNVELIEGDLTDFSSLTRAIDKTKPNELYNLGAISFVGLSFKQPELTANVTGLGPLRLLEAICGILFNHEGEYRGSEFVTRKITQGIALIAAGKLDKIRLGTLQPKRDWGYAGDYVQAMWLMLQQEIPSDYVVATGKTHSIREFFELALDCAGLKGNPEDYVIIDDSFKRPAEVDLLVGDATKARTILGWEPKVSFERLVEKMTLHDLRS